MIRGNPALREFSPSWATSRDPSSQISRLANQLINESGRSPPTRSNRGAALSQRQY